VPGRDPVEGVDIGHLPEEVDRHDRSRARRDSRLNGGGVDEQRVGQHVDEAGPGADRAHRLGGGDKGVRRHDHLVTGPDPEAGEDQLERVGAVGHPHALLRLAVLGERRLEGRDLGSTDEPAVGEHGLPGQVQVLAQVGVQPGQVEEGDRRHGRGHDATRTPG
jgi:hypothetical protein